MSDQEDGNPENNALSVEAIRSINSRLDAVERQQRQDEEEERRHNLSQLRVNRTIAIFTGLLFVTSVISDIFLIRQTNITEGQLAEVKQSSQTATNQTWQAIGNMNWLARTMDESLQNTQRALELSERQGRTGQRPYVTIENARFDPAITDKSDSAGFKLGFHNTGRSPALSALSTIHVLIDGKETEQKPDRFPSTVTIASDRSSEKGITISFSPGVSGSISNGAKIITVKGQIRYTDIFKDWHVSTFCTAYDSVVNVWVYCAGNDVQ